MTDAGGGELFGKGTADGAGRRRAAARVWDLGGKKGNLWTFIREFQSRGRYRLELVFGDADVDGEAELGENGVLDLVGDGEVG